MALNACMPARHMGQQLCLLLRAQLHGDVCVLVGRQQLGHLCSHTVGALLWLGTPLSSCPLTLPPWPPFP